MQKRYAALAIMSLMMFSANANAEGKNGVAAVVNGEEISVAEIRQGYEDNKQIKAKVPFNEFYAKALDVFVNGKLIYQAAEAEDITNSPEFKKQLEIAKEELARKVYLEKKVAAKLNDAEINKVYNDYKKNFKSQKEMKARHILVDSEAKAKEVIEKLKKGSKFDTLAKEYSKEPADLGYFTKGMMVPEFGNAAFALKKGQISTKPVKTQFGYHVIIADDIRDSKALPLKDVKPQIEAMLTQQVIGETLKGLSDKATVAKYGLDGKALPAAAAPAAQ